MSNTVAVAEKTGSSTFGSSQVLENSSAFDVLRSAHVRVEKAVIRFFLWFDAAFKNSIAGRVLLAVLETGQSWAQSSTAATVFGWVMHLCLVPSGGTFEEGTFLGIVLVLGVLLPTEIQILAFLLFLFAVLWRRSVKWERTHGGASCEHKDGRTTQGFRNDNVLPILPFHLQLPFIILFLFVVGAAISSVVPQESMKNLIFWCIGGVVFLFAFDTSRKGGAESIVWPVLAGAAVSSLVGIYQYFTGWQTPSAWVDIKFEDELVRIVGTFTNPNYFAEMLGLALPLALALLVRNKSLRDKSILLLYSGLAAIALVLTWSRGAWLGFMASFALMAIFFDKRLLVLGLIVGVAVLAFAPSIVTERLLSSFSFEDSSNAYRVSVWRGSLALLRDHLFRGIGLGAIAFSEIYPEYMIIQTPSLHSHSLYIQMLIELGFLGFVALTWFLIASVWYSLGSLRVVKGKGIERWTYTGILVGCMSALAGHLIQGVIEYTWYNPQVMLTFWAWLGISAGIAAHLKKTHVDAIE